MRVVFHVELDLDHRDQIAPIIDDLSDRYGVAEAAWAEILDPPPIMQREGGNPWKSAT